MGNHGAKLKSKDLEAIRLSTDFTDDEIRAWYRWYKSVISDCPRGRMDMIDFKIIYRWMFPLGVEDKYVKHVFRSFDTNGDGEVDFREFMVSLSITSRGTLRQKLEWAFKVYDIDGDGFITRNEILEIFSAMHNLTGDNQNVTGSVLTLQDRVDELIKRLDKDDDGKISMDEFVEGSGSEPGIVFKLSQINRKSSLTYSTPIVL